MVVWVGFDDNSDLKLTGGEAAVPIWTDFVKRALALRPDLAAKEFPRPAGVEVLEIDPETGAIANEFCPHKQRLLMTTYLSPGVCLEHQAPLEVFDASLLEAETSATDFVESASYQVIHAPAEESSKLIEDKKPEQKFVEDKPEKKLFFPQIR